jgi:hypothetical protein
MGNYFTKEELDIIDSSVYHMPYSKDLQISCWEKYNSKNWKYYSGERFFKISRKNYRDYQRGYCYGYYYNGDSYVSENEDDEDEYEL